MKLRTTTAVLLGILVTLTGTIWATDVPVAGVSSLAQAGAVLWARKSGTTNTKQDITSTNNALDVNVASGTVTVTPSGTQTVQGSTGGAPIGVRGGNSYFNGSADQSVKSGAGDLVGIFVASSTSCTIKLWDNTAASTTILVNTFSATAGTWYPLPFHFSTGLYVDITNTCDYTVSYN